MATGNSKTKWKREDFRYTDQLLFGEGISLSYAGKASEQDILATRFAELTRAWTDDEKSNNRLYFGDNLPILASMLYDSQIRNKVSLIYIDPPFATNSVFQSRSQSDAYLDLLTGPSYVEFIRKRLILLRELLAEDGSIYIHLDHNMIFHIKVIMDEIFGAKNFRNCITRRKCSHKNFTRKTYGNISDYILFYTKSENYIWNRSLEEWTPERAKKEYPYIDEQTGRRYKKVPIHAPGIRNGATGKPWRDMLPPPGKHWQYPPQALDEMDARGEIYWSPTGNPRRKIYLENSAGIPVQDIWYDFRDDRNQNIRITGYPTEKNPDMIERIIRASSNPGDLVLDCFAGSGTTLAVADRLNRQWIGIDNSVEAITTTLRRFSVGVDRMGDYVLKNKEPGNQDSVQTSMLELLDSDGMERNEEGQKPVRHFSIYTDSQYQASVTEIIQQWINLTK